MRLVLDGGGVIATADDDVRLHEGWGEVTGIDVDGPNEIQQRVTVTRMLTLGLLAFAVPKKSRLSYLVIDDTAGTYVFEVGTHTAIELRSAVQAYRRLLTLPPTSMPPPPPPPAPSPAGGSSEVSPLERLRRLDQARSEGLISVEEHAARRQRIVDEM